MHITLEDSVTEGDKMAVRGVVRGKDAAGNQVNFSIRSMMRLAGGKIVEEWEVAGSSG